jgi:hypothetical protein
MAGILPLAPDIKVFCFFSSEKKAFLCLDLRHARPPGKIETQAIGAG